MSYKKENVAAAVVVYQPDESVLKNIETYRSQTAHLFIADNSEGEESSIAGELQSLSNTDYISMKGNMGIGAALNRCAERAAEKGFTYLLTLDDDSRASESMVQELASAADNLTDAGQTAPVLDYEYDTGSEAREGIEEVDIVLTSGALVNLKAWNEIGGWNEELFIDYVDHDFCLRLILAGWKNYRSNSAVLEHRLGGTEARKIAGKTVYPTHHSPVRVYYQTRNRLWLKKEYQDTFPGVIKREMKLLKNKMLKIALFEKQKALKFKMMRRGFRDFKKGITGKYVEQS